MGHEIVIRGGTVVDGTGAEPFRADVGIVGGRIAEIGKIAANGAREIDADGLTVSPGFIDLHTHLDAQVGWDPALRPVSWHGVTTALMGNCGVTFAPCKPSDREFLAGMMESVEDIPRQAILSGLPWTWEEYGDYLNAVEKLKPGINVAGLVGHSAVRYYVMGERSFAEQASDDEKAQMAQIVGKAVADGAVGFSTNRFAPHKAPDGRSIPGTFADASELVAIGKAVAARGALMQAVGASSDVLKAIADQAGSRVLFSYGVGGAKGDGRKSAEGLDRLAEGRDLTAICQVKGTGFMFGLQCSLPFRGETWDKVRDLDFKGRVAAISDPGMAAKLIEAGETSVPPEHTYYIGDGVVLKHWIRETKVYTLSEGIRRMTSDAARIMGLKDRGTLKAGMRADINVFDLDRVTQLQPEIVHDFPGGAPHFTQRARGYRATLVNGRINLLDDELTGERAGMVLRHGR